MKVLFLLLALTVSTSFAQMSPAGLANFVQPFVLQTIQQMSGYANSKIVKGLTLTRKGGDVLNGTITITHFDGCAIYNVEVIDGEDTTWSVGLNKEIPCPSEE
jgi:hypothetical protein